VSLTPRRLRVEQGGQQPRASRIGQRLSAGMHDHLHPAAHDPDLSLVDVERAGLVALLGFAETPEACATSFSRGVGFSASLRVVACLTFLPSPVSGGGGAVTISDASPAAVSRASTREADPS